MVNSKEQSVTISPSQITSDYIPTREEMATPTPEPSERAGSEASESSGSKKRKSWGQPIPEYQAILPPGKRAKTEEEKEQRRCERIVRNRKAAATSRDRKKMEFERLEQENKILREQLAQQQAIIQAMQNGQPLPTFSQQAPVQFTANAPPTPASLAVEPHTGTSTPRASSPTISVISLSNRPPQKSSPTLTASLFIKNETPEMNSTFAHDSPSFDGLSDLGSLDSFNPSPALDDMITHTISNPQSALESFANIENSGLTQYPAAVLCNGLQCQPESMISSSRLNNKWINSVLIIQLMVLNVMSNIYSKTMLSTMSQILTSLEQILPRLLSDKRTADMILPLMHSLITLPTTETPSRRVFRMAFLRRLLACSPASASPLSEAIARALQRQSSAEAIKESSRDGLSWASLLTMRWAIMCVEREMMLHNKRLKVSTNPSTDTKRSFGMQESPPEGASIRSFGSPGRGTCAPGTHVH